MDWQNTAAGLGLSIAIALLVAQLAARLVRYTLAAATGNQSQDSFTDPITRRPIRVVRAVVFIVIFGLATRPVLNLFDVDLTVGISLEQLTTWLFTQGLRVVLIGLLAYFTVRIAGLGIAFHAKPAVTSQARHAIATLGLDGILYLLGMRDRDIEEI